MSRKKSNAISHDDFSAALSEALRDVGETDSVNHPTHYKNDNAECSGCNKKIECIDVTRHMSFCLGNAMKYIWRCDSKGNAIEDLKKAVWYLHDEIETRQSS